VSHGHRRTAPTAPTANTRQLRIIGSATPALWPTVRPHSRLSDSRPRLLGHAYCAPVHGGPATPTRPRLVSGAASVPAPLRHGAVRGRFCASSPFLATRVRPVLIRVARGGRVVPGLGVRHGRKGHQVRVRAHVRCSCCVHRCSAPPTPAPCTAASCPFSASTSRSGRPPPRSPPHRERPSRRKAQRLAGPVHQVGEGSLLFTCAHAAREAAVSAERRARSRSSLYVAVSSAQPVEPAVRRRLVRTNLYVVKRTGLTGCARPHSQSNPRGRDGDGRDGDGAGEGGRDGDSGQVDGGRRRWGEATAWR
jgi:hypothetical protein